MEGLKLSAKSSIPFHRSKYETEFVTDLTEIHRKYSRPVQEGKERGGGGGEGGEEGEEEEEEEEET